MVDRNSGSEPDCDLAIVGGGILGLAVAMLASFRGNSVHVYRLSNQGKPRAEPLRNQGWLQSGLMYIDKIAPKPWLGDPTYAPGRVLAQQMYRAGLSMLDDLNIPRPEITQRGILRVDPKYANDLLEEIKYLG